MCRRQGRPNASVLPEPVEAMPTRSRPARAMGRHCAWIGEGAEKLRVACSISSDKPVCTMIEMDHPLAALLSAMSQQHERVIICDLNRGSLTTGRVM